MHHFCSSIGLSKALILICIQIIALSTITNATIPEVASTTYNRSFPITTLINAKWSQTPLYLEIAEYLADENKDAFWNFVNDATNSDIANHGSESSSYQAAILLAKKYVGDLQLPILKLVVSVHSLTPRIQTHLKIASEVLQRTPCSNSKAFAEISNEIVCNLDDLKRNLLQNTQHNDDTNARIELYNFDHVFPATENFTRTVIVYGDLGSKTFAPYHNFLTNIAFKQRIRYVMRHYMALDGQNVHQKLVRLSGYGVELHLKSTEYKSQDDSPKGNDTKTYEDNINTLETEVQGFNFSILKQRYPTLGHSLDKLREDLLRSNDDIPQLKAWEFQDLGLQAATAVAAINGEESLQILQFIAHNFPMQAKTLLSYKINEELRNEVHYNTEVLGRSLNVDINDGGIFINGIFFDPESMDLYALIEILRSEVRVLETLHANKVNGALASALLTLDLSSSASRDFAIDIRDTAISWINDIEKDPQYRRWPSSGTDLLRPTFPGMLRNIRKNAFNLVLVVNPLIPSSRNVLKLVESFIIHMAPVRLGLVFDERPLNNDTADDFYALNCAFNYAAQTKDSRAALSFLTDIFTAVKPNQHVERRHIRSQLKKTFKLDYDIVDDIIGDDSDYDYGRQLAVEFVERLGCDDSPQALLNGVPMMQSLLASDSEFEEAIFSEILQQTTTLQKAIFKNELNDNDDIVDYLMKQPHVMPRLNQRILNSNEDSKFLDFTGKAHKDLKNVNSLAELSDRDMTATLLDNLKYFEGKKSASAGHMVHFLTLWIFADVEREDGKLLVANALRYVKSDSTARIAFIPNTEGAHLAQKNNLNRLVWAAMLTLPPVEATDLVLKWLQQDDHNYEIPMALHDILDSTELHIKMLRVYCQKVMVLNAFERLIISNGRFIGPLGLKEKFDIEDFRLLDRFNNIQYGNKLQKILQMKSTELTADGHNSLNSDIVFKLYACLVGRQLKTRFKLPSDVKDKHSVVKLQPKDINMPYFNIIAVVDPATKCAQKLSPILILLRQILNCRMQIILLPAFQHSDMPVTNFYRYVVEPEVQFAQGELLADGPIAKFTGVPSKSLLTQNLHVPENWLVEVVRSVYDLDNIKLSDIGGPVHSEFELEHVLLEGHCFDSVTGAPPRGLQITLGTDSKPIMVDTIVMANLGYFQLKANPGVWTLRLRDGKSADIYDITSADGPNTFHHNGSTQVVITTLRVHVIKLRVTKKSGMQNTDLLGDEDGSTNKGIWNSITSSFGGGSSGNQIDDDADTINIFSVASGHLYERLLRIMMLSLVKHTKSPVKFWFLKNYLSPQFIDFLPHMAREYNLKYELVQYKWPRWLHQQTEKQRTIWGYKILFLDVLFPLNVRKIIFVDADAIVRADLKDLYDMDLEGAPYAYTPFCDSRKEMEGYRFWKQGYWRHHLMGRRYHISALYVVDLKRFRKIAAGDRLRGQYQALTQDPNSLANLDQDLPNNMIHQVAIKSLPDEWLWCQTWCSDSALKKAKVIDLCNNPLTKEAKLTAAQRIVPEWKDYDAEIKALMARIEDHENVDHHDAAAVNEQKPFNDIIDEINDDENDNKHEEL